jgi:hypothetical protein
MGVILALLSVEIGPTIVAAATVLKEVMEQMGVAVLRGADIGLPRNTLVTILQFRAEYPSLDNIKAKWDAVAAALPQKRLPAGIRAISDQAEDFRAQFAPQHPSLEAARELYYQYLKNDGSDR